MSTLPIKIYVANSTNRHALKYGLTIIGTFWVCTFAFSNYFGYPLLYGFGSILTGALAVYLMYRYDRSRKRSIEITKDGIYNVKKGVETQIKWNEMHQLYFKVTKVQYKGIVTVTRLFETQVAARGRNITTDYQFEDFHEQIAELSYLNLMPIIKADLERRNKVSFGQVELDQDYLYVKKKQYDLDSIKEVNAENGELRLKIEGKRLPLKIDLKEVANTRCLVTLLKKEVHLVRRSNWSRV